MAVRKGINNSNLKQENRGLVLKMIVTGECCTRIELAKKTGLSKMSVTNIVCEFIDQGIISEEKAEKVCGQGRNPILLAVTDKAPKIIGLDIHRSKCAAVLSDLKLNVLRRAECDLSQEKSTHFYDIIFQLIDDVMEHADRTDIIGIGAGCSGPVDIKKGMILNSPDFYGLRDLEITKTLSRRYQLPVYMDSQYNCAALAERYFGAGRHFRDFVFLGIMKGIGSGIIADEKILRSSNGFTSEIGHMSIDWNGKRCVCGSRGCLESYTGTEVLRERMIAATGKNLSFQEFCRLSQEGNEPAIDRIFEDMVEKLACGLTSVVNMLNPEAVIIGHDGYFIPDRYLEKMEKIVNQKKLSGEYRHVAILKPYFKNESHILGCACTVLNRVFTGKMDF
jgi:predicted NBD/HSP70 family sugar kinase